jgi:hypothetical protein
MRYLSASELQSAYEAGSVLSVSLLSDGDELEVRVVTTGGDLLLTADDDPHPMRFGDQSTAMSLLNKLGIVKVDTVEDWEIAKIKSSLAGLRSGSNRVFTVDEWAAIRAARKANRGLS